MSLSDIFNLIVVASNLADTIELYLQYYNDLLDDLYFLPICLLDFAETDTSGHMSVTPATISLSRFIAR